MTWNFPGCNSRISHKKRVLRLEERNMYCSICDRYKGENEVPMHKCYKNSQGTYIVMETDGIVAGFQKKYATSIGDGDCSVHRRLIETLPYGPNLLAQKSECRNHILRNYGNRLRDICMKENFENVELRSVMQQNLLRLPTAVTKAVSYRKAQQLSRPKKKKKKLKHSIMKDPCHIFVTAQKEAIFEVNHIPEMKVIGLFLEILSAASRVSYYADSLIEDVDINCVELYNSHIAKAVGGKHINLCLRHTYQKRRGMILNTELEINNQGTSEKRKRLTASNFPSTSCSSLVQSVRYPTFVGTAGTKWGLKHEHVALNELSKHLHMPFRRNALFDEDAISEIKCPYSIKDMSPQEAYKKPRSQHSMSFRSMSSPVPFTTFGVVCTLPRGQWRPLPAPTLGVTYGMCRCNEAERTSCLHVKAVTWAQYLYEERGASFRKQICLGERCKEFRMTCVCWKCETSPIDKDVNEESGIIDGCGRAVESRGRKRLRNFIATGVNPKPQRAALADCQECNYSLVPTPVKSLVRFLEVHPSGVPAPTAQEDRSGNRPSRNYYPSPPPPTGTRMAAPLNLIPLPSAAKAAPPIAVAITLLPWRCERSHAVAGAVGRDAAERVKRWGVGGRLKSAGNELTVPKPGYHIICSPHRSGAPRHQKTFLGRFHSHCKRLETEGMMEPSSLDAIKLPRKIGQRYPALAPGSISSNYDNLQGCLWPPAFARNDDPPYTTHLLLYIVRREIQLSSMNYDNNDNDNDKDKDSKCSEVATTAGSRRQPDSWG
ncbi:hypothetical protein PR048_020282 [Dryococelus australis]|uniref:Mutator-like transposase domain-containing protein n=1 Tax=Dryococelus australis TaxID=614101 RepID=A0ABQ9H5V9_9NEOP|nr:hypothetical protein PR048_020282 [Dryococelus australis]